MSNQSNSSSGIGLGGLLFITFLVLKLCKVIDWSWWYVTMPLWGGLAIFLIGLLFVVIFAAAKESKPFKKQAPVKSRWQERHDQMMESQKKLKK
jgi:hypothetical protein